MSVRKKTDRLYRICRTISFGLFTKLKAFNDVYAKGFHINVERSDPNAVLSVAEFEDSSPSMQLFENGKSDESFNSKFLLQLKFQYNSYHIERYMLHQIQPTHEKMKKIIEIDNDQRVVIGDFTTICDIKKVKD